MGVEAEACEDSSPLPSRASPSVSEEQSLLLKLETKQEIASRKRRFGHLPGIEHFALSFSRAFLAMETLPGRPDPPQDERSVGASGVIGSSGVM